MNGMRRILLVFARNPVPGEVKTRLIPSLGAHKATALYTRLLDGTLAAATTLTDVEVQVHLANVSPNAVTQALLDRYTLNWQPQQGNDLGTRMRYAIADALKSANQVVLIGSDCPEFTGNFLANAFDTLTRHDVVLGPATDGGYVLIGTCTGIDDVFRKIAWGSGTVLDATRQRLAATGLDWHELPALHDIDRVEDLARFPHLQTGL